MLNPNLILDYTQGSESWLEFRKTKIMASDASAILGINPWKTQEQLMQEKLGLTEPKEATEAMKEGLRLEPYAREYFNIRSGIEVKPKVILHSTYEWMGASLDGISDDGQVILEIKVPKIAQVDRVPDIYYPQVQHQIACANVDMAYYLSFDKDVFHGYLIEVPRDDWYIEAMIEKEKAFYYRLMSKLDDRAEDERIKVSTMLMTMSLG